MDTNLKSYTKDVIAIDLGSNTLRVLKYSCTKGIEIADYEKVVRTANSLNINGLIDEDTINRVIGAIKEAKEKINFDNSKIFAVTTEALRVAKNSTDVLNKIKKATEVEIKIISGEEEAQLTLLAVKNRLHKLNIEGNFVLVDIGGGSTELIFYIDGNIYSKSFKLGIVTVATAANSLKEIKELIDIKAKEVEEFAKQFRQYKLNFVATAGTPTTVASMKIGLTYNTYNPKLINGVKLYRDELDIYLQKLLSMSKKDKEIAVGVGRDDLIVAGIVIFEKIYDILNSSVSIIVDDGLREGVALTACESLN